MFCCEKMLELSRSENTHLAAAEEVCASKTNLHTSAQAGSSDF